MSAGFYLPKLEAAIYARLIADTTLIGSTGYAANARNTIAKPDDPLPIVTFEITNAKPSDYMNTRHHDTEFRVHAYVDEEPAGAAYNGFARADQMLTRIVGDWEDQSTRKPSFGFDRWQPDLTASSWSNDIVVMTGCRPSHDPGVLHWVCDFKISPSKAGA